MKVVSLTWNYFSPGPLPLDSALWVAIFSDAITLVRSDRFYTVVSTNYIRVDNIENLKWCRTGTQIL